MRKKQLIKESLKSPKKLYITAAAFTVAFLILILLLLTTDVKQIGPMGTAVGLSTLNGACKEFFGFHIIWYTITDWLGCIGIFTAFCFFILGIVQWISRKKLFKVDAEIIVLGFLYVLIIGTYVFFEFFIVNYRPVILYKNPEASFPSSHTMITCAISQTAIYLVSGYFKDKKAVRRILNGLLIALIIITIVGRTISGVHYITDILGGILLSNGFTFFYLATVKFINKRKQKKELSA